MRNTNGLLQYLFQSVKLWISMFKISEMIRWGWWEFLKCLLRFDLYLNVFEQMSHEGLSDWLLCNLSLCCCRLYFLIERKLHRSQENKSSTVTLFTLKLIIACSSVKCLLRLDLLEKVSGHSSQLCLITGLCLWRQCVLNVAISEKFSPQVLQSIPWVLLEWHFWKWYSTAVFDAKFFSQSGH